jgi:hypothetical protein
MEPSIIAVFSQALLILVVGWATGEEFSYQGAIANGMLVIFAGGTLLLYGGGIGYLLLVYGSFLLVTAAREQEKEEMGGKSELTEYVVKVLGNYIITALIVMLFIMITYQIWPFVPR